MGTKKILYFQYTDPTIGYPPLEHSSAILAREGWQVLFLGVTSFQQEDFCLEAHPNIKIKQLFSPKRGWRQKLNYIVFNLWVILWVLCWRPDWIYASNNLVAPAVLFLSHIYSKNIVYHEHDSSNMETPATTLLMRFIYWTRVRMARRVKVCVIPNQQRADIFEKETGAHGKTVCVWNCPLLVEVRQPHFHRGGDIVVLYHGSLVPQRLPRALLEVVAKIGPEIKLRVTGYPVQDYVDYPQQLKEYAARLGISDRVEFSSAKTRADLLDMCQKCDVGLALMPKESSDINMQFMTGASNKAFDYLACGLALLVSDLPDWKTMFVDSGYGLACDPDSAESIAEKIRWYLEHPKEMRAFGEKGRQKILCDWNYETQFKPIIKKMAENDN